MELNAIVGQVNQQFESKISSLVQERLASFQIQALHPKQQHP